MLALMAEMNHEGETSTAWTKLKAKLQYLLSIPSRAAHNMNEEELRARAAREQEQRQTNEQYGFEEP